MEKLGKGKEDLGQEDTGTGERDMEGRGEEETAGGRIGNSVKKNGKGNG